MATNPVEIPLQMGFNSKTFKLVHNQQVTPIGSGFIQTIERSSPAWIAEYSTPGLRFSRYNAAISFLNGLDGAIGTFLAYDPRRPMPGAYMNLNTTADPWTQSGQTAPRVLSASFSNSTLTLDRMQNGSVVMAGDYISFRFAGIWYLFRTLNGGTVSGNTITVNVRPRPRLPDAYTPTNIRYRKACCEMKMLGSFEEKDSVDGYPTLSFRGTQFINRTGS